jgi:molybdate transport system substrate-binding protein
MRPITAICAAAVMLASAAAAAEPVTLYAAGSLKTALGEVAKAYEATYGTPVAAEFAASGLLRQRIEGGDSPDVFASANMAHPKTLMVTGRGGPVVLFARNRLCAIAQPDLGVTTGDLLEVMLREDVMLGTSTPNADPSGDYAWEMFRKADDLQPGSYERLDAKAQKLTGGPDSPKAPEGRNTYGWVMEERQADLFLTYCTNARLAQKEVPNLQIVPLPDTLAVGADYGLIVLAGDNPEAWRLASLFLSPEAQGILADHGFAVAGVPAEG